MAMCPTARDFSVRQGDLTQKYFVYFKSNQRRMVEKDPSFGYVDNFQTSPNPQGSSALRIFYICRQLRRKFRQLRLSDFRSFGQSAILLPSQLQNV